jgi:hypothetical protein
MLHVLSRDTWTSEQRATGASGEVYEAGILVG